MKRKIKRPIQSLVMFLIMVTYCIPSFATTISDLVRQGEIVAKSYLNTKDPVPIASQVTLVIDVSIPIDARFSQGTNIGHFDLQDAVVLPQGPFALNSVSRIKGKRYINQLWELPIFPQKGGDYLIPPIVIDIGIIHKDETIIGKLVTSPMEFSAFIPSPYISDELPWLVAQEAALSENIQVTRIQKSEDKSEEKPQQYLQVGDSIEREVILSAQSSLAMLFPKLINRDDYQNMGARTYPSQDLYTDKEVRGTRSSTHTEKITMVVQEAGLLVLPDIEVVWWDTKSKTEKRLKLPGQEWQVKHTVSSFIMAYRVQLMIAVAILVTVCLCIYRLYSEVKRRKRNGTMPLWYQFFGAIRKKNWGQSESLLYRKIKRDTHRLTITHPQQSDEWKRDATNLQIERYRDGNGEATTKAYLVSLWNKLR